MSNKQSYEFQAEIKQLLHILAFSLYQHKDVFIRELVSNASDALNKINYLELKNEPDIYGKGAELCVRIEFDKTENAFIIKDTGIGMTKQELIENIGTIAKSGTKAFLEKISEDKKQNLSDVIGQFGVGFYSAFIVAHKVEVITKSYITSEPAYKWTSDGAGKYDIEEIEKKDRGTEIRVFLKDDEKEFLEAAKIKSIIQKYSNFIRFPIYIENEKANEVSAIWTKQPASVTEQEYNEFYKFISHGDSEPAFYVHKTADVPIQFSMLLFAPKKNYNMFGLPEKEYGLALYSNKVMIQEQCKDIIPQYFRFIRGIVDSADIPLNLSRETIQNNAVVQKIRNIIIKNLISEMEKKMKLERDKYIEFYNEFQRELKEGVHSDFSNKDKLAKLLLFKSMKSDDKYISLNEYIENKKNDQKEIYYISNLDINAIIHSPYLEIFKKKDVDVLYLTDPADEIVLSGLGKFEELEFKSIDNADLGYLKNLADSETEKEKEDKPAVDTKKLKKFIDYLKDALKDKVSDVTESDRLVDSPCCLVSSQPGMSSHFEKMMKMMDKNYQGQKKVLQINPKNELIRNMTELFESDKKSDLLKAMAEQLVDNTLMIDGELEKPLDTTLRIYDIMAQALKIKLSKN